MCVQAARSLAQWSLCQRFWKVCFTSSFSLHRRLPYLAYRTKFHQLRSRSLHTTQPVMPVVGNFSHHCHTCPPTPGVSLPWHSSIIPLSGPWSMSLTKWLPIFRCRLHRFFRPHICMSNRGPYPECGKGSNIKLIYFLYIIMKAQRRRQEWGSLRQYHQVLIEVLVQNQASPAGEGCALPRASRVLAWDLARFILNYRWFPYIYGSLPTAHFLIIIFSLPVVPLLLRLEFLLKAFSTS